LECNLPFSFTAYAASLALIPWIKSEGVILWSLLALIGLAVGLYQRRIRSAIWSILPGLLLAIGWRCYLKAMHCVLPSDFSQPTLDLLSRNLNRLGTISGKAFAEVTDTGGWSIFWLLTLVAISYLLVSRRLSRLLLVIGVLGPVVLYLLTYIFSAWPSYTAHVTSSFPRLLLHVMPAAWLAIGLALSSLKTQTGKL
jgi:hypothetical protein